MLCLWEWLCLTGAVDVCGSVFGIYVCGAAYIVAVLWHGGDIDFGVLYSLLCYLFM
jgi:hypothetical protein